MGKTSAADASPDPDPVPGTRSRHVDGPGEHDPNLGRLLLQAFELFVEELVRGIRARGFSDFRLSNTQVLRNLETEGTRITTLAERARMTKQAMSELVHRLDRDGIVERRPDPDDGRAKRVHLTARGEEVVDAAREAHDRLIERWEQDLGEEELSRVRQLLFDLLASQDALPRHGDLLDQ